jgi:hypothetical protein
MKYEAGTFDDLDEGGYSADLSSHGVVKLTSGEDWAEPIFLTAAEVLELAEWLRARVVCDCDPV